MRIEDGLVKNLSRLLMSVTVLILSLAAAATSTEDPRLQYANELLERAGAGKRVSLQVDTGFDNPEAFSIKRDEKGVTIRAGWPAGLLYGVQQYLTSPTSAASEVTEKPDFELRGTVLFLMKEGGYDYQLTPEEFPWFFDRFLLTRFLDYLAENRINTIFLWTGHLFPSIVEMPEYPDATSLTKQELLRNQEQFRWFTSECAKRNISVLLHFYNIHISAALARNRNIPIHYREPNEFVTKYIGYSLRRFLEEFDSVGLYVCPGEQLKPEFTAEWIRDVIFKAAKESGKKPRIVIRDWGLDAEKFKKICKDEYDNYYTELKHNVEMIVSPVPDERHAFWTGVGKKHIVNLHEIADIKPFRWGSPKFIQEMVQEWKKIGLNGAEVYGMVSWRWPYSLDKLDPNQTTFWPEGPKLLTFQRDAIWLEAIGRYLWKADRNPAGEEKYWAQQLGKKFGSEKAGQLLLQWYDTTGPILPGLQNLTSVKNMNWHPTAIGVEQYVDEILAARQGAFGPEANRGWGRYPSRPVDTYFFERYKARYNLPNLTNRISMPVSEYADKLAKSENVTDAMTADKITDLFVEMAKQSVKLAENAQSSATENKAEAGRFATDSQALVYITQAWRYKIMAAIEKQLWLKSDDEKHKKALLQYLQDAIDVYEKLVALTDKTYINATDMVMRLNWHNGLEGFKDDLAKQKEYIFFYESRKKPDFYWLETEDMQGGWTLRSDYPGYSGRGFSTTDGLQDRTKPLRQTIEIKTPGRYSVWARGFIIKAGNDCAFAVEVSGKKFERTHGEQGTEQGQYVWRKTGEVDLQQGPAEVLVRDAGTGFDCPDVIVLTKDAGWTPLKEQ